MKLAEVLNQCTSSQQALFARIYPNGVPANKLVDAYDLCERTLKKNVADPSRVTGLLLKQI